MIFRHLAIEFILTLSKSSSRVKVHGHRRNNDAKVARATPSKDFLDSYEVRT